MSILRFVVFAIQNSDDMQESIFHPIGVARAQLVYVSGEKGGSGLPVWHLSHGSWYVENSGQAEALAELLAVKNPGVTFGFAEVTNGIQCGVGKPAGVKVTERGVLPA